MYGFRFPFFLTASHMAFCFVALLPRELCRARSGDGQDPVRRQWRGLLGIGAFLACGISLNNISLMDISLSLNQVIRSSIPVVTCLLSMAVEGKVPSGLEATSLVVLSTGVMIAVWEGTVAGQPLGIVFCVLGTLSSGLMVTFSGEPGGSLPSSLETGGCWAPAQHVSSCCRLCTCHSCWWPLHLPFLLVAPCVGHRAPRAGGH